MPSTYDYSVFGLAVRSDIDLPELMPLAFEREADVTIRMGEVAGDENIRPGLHANGTEALLIIPGVARYSIHGGTSITIAPASGVDVRNVRLYLLGSAFGAMLHQRGLLPLHANAVEVAGNAIAFMGASGSGKSTLASWFHDRGFRVLSDDVCVVDFESEKPSVRPGIARLRLWRAALTASGRVVSDFEPSFIGEGAPDKFDVSLMQSGSASDRVQLAAIYLLDRAEKQRIEKLSGAATVEAIFANTYRGGFIERVGNSRDHWTGSVRLAQSVPTFRAERLWGLPQLDSQSAVLLKHAEDQIENRNPPADAQVG